MTHDLKIHGAYYHAVASGRKTFEIRQNDRDYTVGDRLHLKEYDTQLGVYLGGELLVEVTYITDYGQPEGQVVMAIKKVVE